MAIARPMLGLVALLLLAGGIVMEFLVVLSGGINSSPVNQVFFLQADTAGITSNSPNYHNPARWTWNAVCGVENGLNANCGPVHAAQSFSPARNFGTTQGLPAAFTTGHNKFYWLSRFAWAFYVVSLFFGVIAFFLGFIALCTRLGAYLTGVFTTLALFFQTLTAALMTAWTVEGRNAFRRNGQQASIGVKAYAFTWATMGCFLVATVLFCVGGSLGKNESKQKSSYFGRKRSTRSRGSFIDNESQRRVKDEYD